MNQTPRRAVLRAGGHLLVHAVTFLLSAVTVVYAAAELSPSPFVTIPLTIGILSVTPTLSRRTLRRFEGLRPRLERVHFPTPVSTN